ncbi:MAG: LuxR C-terminal-related transcriptional regulator [Actinomycetota bacterium]|nr:LuxR C-terminal-related transcriptional regulator [Actinomycetota bacterium]
MSRHEVDASALRELMHVLAAPPRQANGAPVLVRDDVLCLLERLVPADVVHYSDLAPRRRFTWVSSASLWPDFCLHSDEDESEDDDPFWDLYWDSGCSYADRTGDLSVTVVTDFYSLREARQTPMHAHLSEAGAVFDREMMMPLPGPPGHSRRIRFLRHSGRDFDATERAIANLVRPHLAEYLHVRDLASRDIRPLTTRQRHLVSLVAQGFSNTQIARTLGITPDTVRTHLQQIYARLGVASRGEAAALVNAPGTVVSLGAARARLQTGS